MKTVIKNTQTHIVRQPVIHSDKMADYLANKRAGARIDIDTNRHTRRKIWEDGSMK